jgi:AmmeMemoRadiSam system protein B
MIRQPAVANRFYPGSPDELRHVVAQLLPAQKTDRKEAIAAIAPHAGYVYSGKLAASTIGSIAVPETTVILGPNHHGRGAAIAVSTSSWQLPGGIVPCDTALAESILAASPLLTADEQAHQQEHSLEVQVPFLQAMQPNLSLVAIALSQISYDSCREVAAALALAISSHRGRVLLLASTDMSHYESRRAASVKDHRALDRILNLDAEGLYRTVISERISMCGFIPVTITVLAAEQLGATTAELIGYTDSGEASGDTDQVVGYAGLVIS